MRSVFNCLGCGKLVLYHKLAEEGDEYECANCGFLMNFVSEKNWKPTPVFEGVMMFDKEEKDGKKPNGDDV